MSAVPVARRTVGRARERLGRTLEVCVAVFRRRRPASLFAVVTVAYLLTFLWAMTDLVIRAGTDFGVTAVVDDPLSRMFVSGPGPYTWEPIALVEFGVGALAFSPLNTVLGLLVASLVGLNLAMTYLAITQPASCSIGTGSGVAASVPALLAGSACCAPAIFLALGLQAGGLLLTAFTWLLPLGVLALLGSLLYLGGQVDPTAM